MKIFKHQTREEALMIEAAPVFELVYNILCFAFIKKRGTCPDEPEPSL
jgi:hypothetical protein